MKYTIKYMVRAYLTKEIDIESNLDPYDYADEIPIDKKEFWIDEADIQIESIKPIEPNKNATHKKPLEPKPESLESGHWQDEYCEKFGLCDMKTTECQCKEELKFIKLQIEKARAEGFNKGYCCREMESRERINLEFSNWAERNLKHEKSIKIIKEAFLR
jgi:hypothetical protein